jgi:hypothetical protein
MDKKELLEKIADAEKLQASLMRKLQRIKPTEENYEKLKVEISRELTAASLHLQGLRALEPLKKGLKEAMDKIPSVDELKETIGSSAESVAAKAKDLFGKMKDGLKSLAEVEEAKPVVIDDATRKAFEAVKNLLAANQRPLARQVIVALAVDKGITLGDQEHVFIIDHIETLVGLGQDEGALHLFADKLREKSP